MKNFIVATLIFIVVSLVAIITDALWLYKSWLAMPNILYYAFGWLAAGIYIAIKSKRSKS